MWALHKAEQEIQIPRTALFQVLTWSTSRILLSKTDGRYSFERREGMVWCKIHFDESLGEGDEKNAGIWG